MIPRFEAREVVGGHWRRQIVALGLGVAQKLLIDDATHAVASQVRRIGAAVPVTKPTGHRVTSALLQGLSKHIQGLGFGDAHGWVRTVHSGIRSSILTKEWHKTAWEVDGIGGVGVKGHSANPPT